MAGTLAPEIQFLGAAGTVTGSRFLLTFGHQEILVDAGLFQGSRRWRQGNWDDLPVPVAALEAVLLTHAHLDHCGYLPRLFRQGYRGPIFATENTVKLAEIVLRDSARLQVEDTEYAKKKGYSRHPDPQPLYDEADAEGALSLFEVVDFRERVDVAEGVTARFSPAGHILGAATLDVSLHGRRIVFSGDLGSGGHPLLANPDPIAPGPVDAVVLESTYGDRIHPALDDTLAQVVQATLERGGTVVIPAFAVDRTEVILMALRDAIHRGEIAGVPILVDSPMAVSAYEVYQEAIAEGTPEIRPDIVGSGALGAPRLRLLRSVDESKSANRHGPCIIIAASGMASGGRVLHHLKRLLPDEKNTVVLVGFQAEGTRGALLEQGAEFISIHGEDIAVRAEVVSIDQFSVHADQNDLLSWLGTLQTDPKKIFVVHGEDSARENLAQLLQTRHPASEVLIPGYREVCSLG